MGPSTPGIPDEGRGTAIEAGLLRLSRDPVCEPLGPIVRVRQLTGVKDPIDTTDKFVLENGRRRPRGFVLVASDASPHLVARAIRALDAARRALGPLAGQAVLAPVHHGYIEGRSFAIFHYYRPMSEDGLLGRWHRLRVREDVLRWLRDVIRLTCHAPTADEDASFSEALRGLIDDAQVSGPVRRRAEQAAERLQSGLWRPCHVLAHNDLWKGNLLLAGSGRDAEYRFLVVDWAGAQVDGYGIYDLIRVDESLRLPRRRLRQELSAHCELLDCPMQDAWSHLLSALGNLARNLDHFPRETFLAMADRCCRRLEAVLPEVDAPPPRSRPTPPVKLRRSKQPK